MFLFLHKLLTEIEMRLKVMEAMGARQAMGLPVSLPELAEAVYPKKPKHSREQLMRRVIRGEASSLKFEELVRLSRKLDVSVDWLLGIEEN